MTDPYAQPPRRAAVYSWSFVPVRTVREIVQEIVQELAIEIALSPDSPPYSPSFVVGSDDLLQLLQFRQPSPPSPPPNDGH